MSLIRQLCLVAAIQSAGSVALAQPAPAQPAPAQPAPAQPAPAQPAPALPEQTSPAPAPDPAPQSAARSSETDADSAAPLLPVEPSAVEPSVAASASTAPLDAALTTPRPRVGYRKGFYIEDGVNSLGIQARVQVRYTHLEADGAPNEDAFSIVRARLTLKGKVFDENLSYKFQADFGKGFVTLKDFYFDYCLADDIVCVRPGQFKRPFSRQQITSSGNLEFVDRSITDKAFDAGRDIGILLHDNYEKSPTFEYALGLFNGTGEKSGFSGSGTTDLETGDVAVTGGSFSNVPRQWHPALVARLGYNHGDVDGYSEADFDGGGLRFGVAASVETHFDADNDDDSLLKGEVDYVVKLHGLSVTGGVYHTSEQDGSGFGDRANGDGGAHFQFGYLILDKYQPVIRYGIVDPRHLGTDDIEEEFAFGINVYLKEHLFKWQNDLTALAHAETDTTDWMLRSQAQLAF